MRSRRTRQSGLLLTVSLIFLLLVCVCVALAAGLITSSGSKAAQAPANRIVYGLPMMPDGFDPHINNSVEMGIVLRSIYDTLVYRDPQTREIVPGLAEKWIVSPDGLTYTFTLRSGIKFHDGTPLDANAVAANLDRIANPVIKSEKALALLGPYDHYTVVDPRTIQIVLKAPFAPLLDGLCQVNTGIASPQAFRYYDSAQYQFHQVGTGPYQMVDYVPGDHFTIRRNPDYHWGPSFYSAPGPQSVDQVEFRFFTDPSTRTPALTDGTVNVIGELSPSDAILFTGNSQLRLYPQPIPGEPLLFLMNTSQPPTDSLDFRRALLAATNRSGIVDAVFQQFSPVADGPLSANTLYYDARVKGQFAYNPAITSDVFTNLGYTLDDNKMLEKDGKILHLVMIVPPWQFIPDVADRLKSQWHDLGIELEIRQVPNLTGLQDAVKAKDYNLIAYDDFDVDPDVLSTVFGSGATFDWTHYANGDLDNALARGRQILQPDQRKAAYAAIQNQVMDQALALPVRDYVDLNGATANVQHLSFDAYGWYPLLPNLTLNGPAPVTPAAR